MATKPQLEERIVDLQSENSELKQFVAEFRERLEETNKVLKTVGQQKDAEMLKILKGIAMQLGLTGNGQPIDLIAEIYKLIGKHQAYKEEMTHYKKIIDNLTKPDMGVQFMPMPGGNPGDETGPGINLNPNGNPPTPLS